MKFSILYKETAKPDPKLGDTRIKIWYAWYPWYFYDGTAINFRWLESCKIKQTYQSVWAGDGYYYSWQSEDWADDELQPK